MGNKHINHIFIRTKANGLEQDTGVGPAQSAWGAEILPMN